MSECNCKVIIDSTKTFAREGIARELMAQISDRERQIAHLSRQVDMLTLDLAIARGEINFEGVKK
jgi:hypothetical protein